MLSKVAPPNLSQARCSRLGHVDPRAHCPMSDKLPIDAGKAHAGHET
jgi:hypothetical protein